MTPEEIFLRLSSESGFPEEALKAASECREAMVPLFCAAIEKHLALPFEDRLDPKPNPVFFAFHLLGEWGEKSAYRPMARLLRLSCDEIEAILGDAGTETSHRVMAAVFDGDPAPLFDVILDEGADEYCRARMCATLVMLVRDGLLARDVVASFLRDAFDKLRPREVCFVWEGWVEAIAMMGLEELKPLAKQALEKGYVDPDLMKLDDFEKYFQYGVENPYKARYGCHDEYDLWANTIEVLRKWSSFSERAAESDDEDDMDNMDIVDSLAPSPYGQYINPYKYVGRNDLCPCGSSKKFKKCCGQ